MASISNPTEAQLPRVETGERATVLPHRAGFIVFGALVTAFCIELVSHWVKSRWPEYPVADGIISAIAILTVLSPGLYLIFRIRNAQMLRYSMVAGSVLILASQFLQLTAKISLIDEWILFGNDGAGHDAARWASLAIGLVLMLASLYFALFTAVRAESALHYEHIELLSEIDRRKRLDEALIEQDNVYRAAITQAGAIPYRIDWATRRYTFYDDQIFALLGLRRDEVTFERMHDLIEDIRYIGPLAGMPVAEVQNLISDTAIRNWHREYRIRTQMGDEKWISDSSVEVISTDGLARETIGLMVDVTQRHREDEAIQRNERYFRALTENAQDLITVINLDGTIRYESPSIKAMLGYDPDELIGKSVFDLVHPDDRSHVLRTMLEGLRNPQHTYRIEFRCKHVDGTWHRLESIGSGMSVDSELDGAVINSRDITERENLQHQLIQSQKMQGIGRLAGGVAHDFNNLLTAIMGYCEFAMLDVPEGDSLHGKFEQIMLASSRAADLTRQLLAFARKQIAEPRNIDLTLLTQNLEKLFRRLIGEDIEMKTCFAPEAPIAYVDPVQFEQVLVNLVVNARDAMPKGGKLTIEIGVAELDEKYAEYHPEVKPGKYVMLAVSDTGVGMSEETRAHIFEPFFTTKEDGKGTGLGLATCYGIVKQLGGHIWVYSELGRGSTFKVYLPRVDGEATNGLPKHRVRPAQGGTETILVVEDETLVRSITVDALVSRGYRVIEATGGVNAIELAKSHDGAIDLLLTDVVMPTMSGRQLADILKAQHESLKVLYMSGYTEDAIVHHGELEPGIAFLPKPFTPEVLARKVRAVLDQDKEAGLASV